ncbi:dof zinc finger protein DOF3.4-like [Jatropha curcas]|uniref:dof zinc finger protein DOF3.4-like n=1 Tax=Jatropha curcas TaxID=180498 RepID=UPI0018939B5E|nr:dof zinc finger protein DOF3.4-like [Jatropha curcas]
MTLQELKLLVLTYGRVADNLPLPHQVILLVISVSLVAVTGPTAAPFVTFRLVVRDIPVGGDTRKNAKRSRTSSSGFTVVGPMTATTGNHNLPLPATPVLVPLMANQATSIQFGCGGGDGKGNVSGSSGNSTVSGSFTSLLNTQGPGFLALSGFGLGLGSAFEYMGFGLARGVWPFPGVGDGGAGGVGGNGGSAGGMSNTWQFPFYSLQYIFQFVFNI